jgi:hypothetical protein
MRWENLGKSRVMRKEKHFSGEVLIVYLFDIRTGFPVSYTEST